MFGGKCKNAMCCTAKKSYAIMTDMGKNCEPLDKS